MGDERQPGRLTLKAKAAPLRLDSLAQLLGSQLAILKDIEREVTGKRRTAAVWRVVELSYDGAELVVTVEG